ncbi:helix-turn-helix transcriptional regulator [Mesorhizobium sp. CAU 1741]|uniref:helix-turn-helix transcriptional regulator n=1 Tax=Mesorhizobium sp. CAU 1741 TaxID=3140366 RepID=UPI00325A6FEB
MYIPNEASDFLLELYNDAYTFKPDELRQRSLANLQRFISFDFAVWGGGWADGRTVTDLVTLHQSSRVLEEWHDVADSDQFCDLTLSHLGTTARFDDIADYRQGVAYNEHWRRFNAAHMMATIIPEKSDGYVSFVGLCADDRPKVFSENERDIAQVLMPHLSQALRMSRDLWTERVRTSHEAVALIDAAGGILATQGPFQDFADAEWGIRLHRVPALAMNALLSRGQWRGQVMDARLSSFEENYFMHVSIHPVLCRLSRRERDVAELFASGMTSKQVAQHLGTSPATVRNQIVSVYEKLEISNKAALARLVGNGSTERRA